MYQGLKFIPKFGSRHGISSAISSENINHLGNHAANARNTPHANKSDAPRLPTTPHLAKSNTQMTPGGCSYNKPPPASLSSASSSSSSSSCPTGVTTTTTENHIITSQKFEISRTINIKATSSTTTSAVLPTRVPTPPSTLVQQKQPICGLRGAPLFRTEARALKRQESLSKISPQSTQQTQSSIVEVKRPPFLTGRSYSVERHRPSSASQTNKATHGAKSILTVVDTKLVSKLTTAKSIDKTYLI